MKTDDELLKANAHIPTAEILQDIFDTEAEIATMEKEADWLEDAPPSMEARLNYMKAKAKRIGIKERREFIDNLQKILALREK